MKILHINDYYIYSWAEKVYRDIFEKLWWEKITLIDYVFNNKILKLYNKLFFSFFIYNKIKKIVKKYNPDVILLHQINLSPFSVLLAIKWNKNVVQIVHDATQAWCPSAWTIYRKNYWKCDVKMSYKKCSKNCAYDKSKIWFFVYYFWLKLFLFLKKKIIKKYISPSDALRNILINNNYKNIITLWNSIEFKKTDNKQKKENIMLYVWAVDKRKWIDKILEAVDELDFIKNNWKFIIIWDWDIYNDLKWKYNNNFYNFLWRLDNKEVINYYKKSKIVFIPSLCFESFWLVALEGIIYDNIVLWNNIWWIPEIISKDNIFNTLNKNEIKNKLIDILNNFDFYYIKSQKQKSMFLEKNKLYFDNLLKILKK